MAQPPQLVVRPLRQEDLPGVVAVHMAAFGDAALSAVGPGAVRRYYLWLLQPLHQSSNFVAVLGDEIVGFCIGGVFRGAMGGFLRRNGPYLAWAVLRAWRRLFEPRFRGRVLLGARLAVSAVWRQARLRILRPPPGPAPPAGDRAFGILSIATAPEAWGRGVGRALMTAAEAEARRRGFRRMGLTVHAENERAVRFYASLGWERVPTADGGWHGEMSRRIV